jgi:hypothetical protein
MHYPANKIQTPKTKIQDPEKIQTQSSDLWAASGRVFDVGVWCLSGAWCLLFGFSR